MKKFVKLFEAALSKYTNGGFSIGDLVKFKENILKGDFFKNQPEEIKSKVQDLLASDLNLRVAHLKPRDTAAFGAANSDYNGTDYSVEVGQELMPGRLSNFITVPSSLLNRVDVYPNLAPIPDSVKRKSIVTKPEPFNAEENNEEVEFYSPYKTRRTDKGDGKLTTSDTNLQNKNIKIPAKPAEGVPDPAKSTAKYLPKEK